jgi:predicted membrane protein
MDYSPLEMILMSILFVIYIVCLFTVAGITFRNGHWILGVLGIFFPILWLIGVVLPPTTDAVLLED